MATVTCVSESVFSDALTRGRCYEVLSRDDAKAQVRIVGNNRRRRWFPIACFAEGQIDVPRLRSVALEGQADLVVGPLEVTITLTDGTQRFCWVATPTRLSQSGDLLVVGEKSVRFHAPNHNLLILSDTSRASIEALLHHLDRQGELEGCTTAEGDFIERDEAGEPITGAYSLLIDGSFSDERYVAASRGALMNATIVDADSLVVSGSARFVDRLNHAEPTTFFVTTTRLSAGTLTHDLYRQGSLPAFVRKQWTFDDLVLITADDSMSNERLHSINGRVRVNRPESASSSCLSGDFEMQTDNTILEANRNSGAFSAGAIRINAVNRITFLGDDAGVEIKSNEQTTSLASGAKLFEFGRCAY